MTRHPGITMRRYHSLLINIPATAETSSARRSEWMPKSLLRADRIRRAPLLYEAAGRVPAASGWRGMMGA